MFSKLVFFSNLLVLAYTLERTNIFSNHSTNQSSAHDKHYAYKQLYVRQQIECAAVCQREEECSAVTYNKTSRLCSLISDVERNCSTLTSSPPGTALRLHLIMVQ